MMDEQQKAMTDMLLRSAMNLPGVIGCALVVVFEDQNVVTTGASNEAGTRFVDCCRGAIRAVIAMFKSGPDMTCSTPMPWLNPENKPSA